MFFKMISQEPSFVDEPSNPFAEGCYLASKSFYNIGVLHARVVFWQTFKIQARCNDIHRFSSECITRDVKQHIFVRNESQCDVND